MKHLAKLLIFVLCGCSTLPNSRQPASSKRKAISFTSYDIFQAALMTALNSNGRIYEQVRGALDGQIWQDTVSHDEFNTIELAAIITENAEQVRITCRVVDDGLKLETDLVDCLSVGTRTDRIPNMTLPDQSIQVLRM